MGTVGCITAGGMIKYKTGSKTGEVTGRMLRRLRDGVKDYIHRTDVLLMVLALVI